MLFVNVNACCMFQEILKALEMSGDISFWGRTYVTAGAVIELTGLSFR